MKVAVILVAAGSGVRLGASVPKAFAPLCGEPLLAHALRGVFGCREVGHVIVVAPATHLELCRKIIAGGSRMDASDVDASNVDAAAVAADAVCVDAVNVGAVNVGAVNTDAVDVVAGGADRSASVKAGLSALHHDDAVVLVHDVARCLAPSDLFARVIAAVRAGDPAVIPGLPMTDTVKVVDSHGGVLETPDRESLRAIQTPQGFLREVLERAHDSSRSATDDAGLVERSGGHVRVVPGDHRALKITSPLDLTVATALLQDGAYAG